MTNPKDFSIENLYSQLEKYQENLSNFGNSRTNTPSKRSSHHQRPLSSHFKNYQCRKSQYFAHLSRFTTKPKYDNTNPNTLNKQHRYIYKKSNQQQKSTLLPTLNLTHQDSLLKSIKAQQQKQNHHPPPLSYPKNQKQIQKNSVDLLLTQLNKRDQIYSLIVRKVGDILHPEEKLVDFFNRYEKMKVIVQEFKKMGKLCRYDDDQLYRFLKGEQDNKEISESNNQSNLKEIQLQQ